MFPFRIWAATMLCSHPVRAFVVDRSSECRRRLVRTMMATGMMVVDEEEEEQLVSDMLHRVRAVNHMPDEIRSSLLDFKVEGVPVGKVRPGIAAMLCDAKNVPAGRPPVFGLVEDEDDDDGGSGGRPFLTLTTAAGASPDERTRAVAGVMAGLRDGGFVDGWRDELYPVSSAFNGDPLFLVERAAVSVLGVLEYGVHVNGLVRGSSSSSSSPSSSPEEEEETKMWIARRSATKSKFPNFLDHIVAGGQPAGVSLLENVVKECGEEAGIGEDVARSGVRPAGAISYENWDPETDKVTRCVLFNYDLYLPPGFEPVPVDGEVQGFMLWTMDQVKASMAETYGDPIKPNCYVVIVDYLLRTGQVSPDSKGYLDVLRALRSGDCQ